MVPLPPRVFSSGPNCLRKGIGACFFRQIVGVCDRLLLDITGDSVAGFVSPPPGEIRITPENTYQFVFLSTTFPCHASTLSHSLPPLRPLACGRKRKFFFPPVFSSLEGMLPVFLFSPPQKNKTFARRRFPLFFFLVLGPEGLIWLFPVWALNGGTRGSFSFSGRKRFFFGEVLLFWQGVGFLVLRGLLCFAYTRFFSPLLCTLHGDPVFSLSGKAGLVPPPFGLFASAKKFFSFPPFFP